MARIRYLIARVLKMNYINMFKIAKSVSKKANRSFFSIFFDMIKCGMKYQAGYYDYQEFEFYNIPEDKRNTYLTRGKNNAIIRKYNNKEYTHIFDDKIEFNNTFSEYLNRDWLNIKISSLSDFSDFVKKNPVIIAKPIDGEGGNGIEKYTVSSSDDISSIYNTIKSKKQFLVEAFVKQHMDMNTLYANSVNTMRMFTFYKDGKGHFLQATLKIGNGGVIDNFSNGGMYTFVEEDGTVAVPAIDKNDTVYKNHPITNTNIVGFKVPMFAEAVDLVERAAEVVPQIAYVGWDVAISENGPVIIEGNCFPGVFQKKASFNKDKIGLIPKYSQYMEI